MKILHYSILATLLVLIYPSNVFAQSKYVIQGFMSDFDSNSLNQRTNDLKSDLNCEVVRLDAISQRFFIIRSFDSRPSQLEVKNLLVNYLGVTSCIQIHLMGSEPVAKYPFTNCEND